MLKNSGFACKSFLRGKRSGLTHIVAFEIAARFFESLAMTWKQALCHCEERSKPVPAKAGKAISFPS
jgi:hypothetical protein